jgi:hypothetical protein
MAVVSRQYDEIALTVTGTSAQALTDFGLALDASLSHDWLLTWKLVFNQPFVASPTYNQVSLSTPVFDITYPGSNHYWGTSTQIYRGFESNTKPVGITCGSWQGASFNGSEAGERQKSTLPVVTTVDNESVQYVLTQTALIRGYINTDTSIVYPTVACYTGYNEVYIYQGYGVSIPL